MPWRKRAKGRCKLQGDAGMPGAGLTARLCTKARPDRLALKPYRGKLAVRNFREGDGNVGIIRRPDRAIALPDQPRPLPLRRRAATPFRPSSRHDSCRLQDVGCALASLGWSRTHRCRVVYPSRLARCQDDRLTRRGGENISHRPRKNALHSNVAWATEAKRIPPSRQNSLDSLDSIAGYLGTSRYTYPTRCPRRRTWRKCR